MKNLTQKHVNAWIFDKNLSVEDLRLLLYLAGNPSGDILELSKLFGLANSTTSKRLGKLKKLGYVEKVKGVFQILEAKNESRNF